tara:strand:+ start:478 stop:1188 length:711 start_codon:yes stop_codon:yes gene_type:complete
MERLTGKQAQSLMEAVASVYEKKEDCVDKDKKTKHNCAKKVCHKEHGEGACIPGKHTLLEDGTVTHYSVVFEHGVEEMIPVEDLEVLVTEMHEHAEMEGEDLQEVDLGKLYNIVVNSVSAGAGAASRAASGMMRDRDKPMKPAASGSPPPKKRQNPPGGANNYRLPERTPQNAKNVEYYKDDVDLFDVVKGHLVDEGLTEDEALKKMLTLTDEERSEIIEGSCGSKKKKKSKKGGY